jgi:hypothetical protein
MRWRRPWNDTWKLNSKVITASLSDLRKDLENLNTYFMLRHTIYAFKLLLLVWRVLTECLPITGTYRE